MYLSTNDLGLAKVALVRLSFVSCINVLILLSFLPVFSFQWLHLTYNLVTVQQRDAPVTRDKSLNVERGFGFDEMISDDNMDGAI